ncbi:GNAT family N-acetyltransferase [Chelatococcus sambhunathii]|uniref:GNAT family N-acetyltransferase n=1 Tax=Chelatococcus sambhunathii TaxID=363953 RepID=A0ABU1DG06_9HYPH|nr:GNAT family N-acetyltransferase [Chelatococcus sambhunathii]MDR4307068.1 GNAT family N-acetyltransferase [Chelatococcus sambhunathii]
MTDLIVREARDEDAGALAALVRAVSQDQPDGAVEAAERPSLDQPAASFAERDGRLWLLMSQDEAVGALGVYRGARPKEFDLALIGLDREQRGLGLAAALLAGAEAFAAASGGAALGVWVDTRLSDAIDFLQRQGFVREPGLKGRHEGSDAVEIRFSRPIGAGSADGDPVSRQPSEAHRDAAV